MKYISEYHIVVLIAIYKTQTDSNGLNPVKTDPPNNICHNSVNLPRQLP
jgi:hypothetical protein